MNWDDMNTAIREAESKLSLLDGVAEKLARMLVGRLRKVNSKMILSELKNELRNFNRHTGKWS